MCIEPWRCHQISFRFVSFPSVCQSMRRNISAAKRVCEHRPVSGNNVIFIENASFTPNLLLFCSFAPSFDVSLCGFTSMCRLRFEGDNCSWHYDNATSENLLRTFSTFIFYFFFLFFLLFFSAVLFILCQPHFFLFTAFSFLRPILSTEWTRHWTRSIHSNGVIHFYYMQDEQMRLYDYYDCKWCRKNEEMKKCLQHYRESNRLNCLFVVVSTFLFLVESRFFFALFNYEMLCTRYAFTENPEWVERWLEMSTETWTDFDTNRTTYYEFRSHAFGRASIHLDVSTLPPNRAFADCPWVFASPRKHCRKQ